MSEQQEKKEKSSEHVSVKVVAPDGGAVVFKIKKTTQLKKLMDSYCERAGIERSSVRFVFDGNTILGENTPRELDMQDEDSVEVFNAQTGGDGEHWDILFDRWPLEGRKELITRDDYLRALVYVKSLKNNTATALFAYRDSFAFPRALWNFRKAAGHVRPIMPVVSPVVKRATSRLD